MIPMLLLKSNKVTSTIGNIPMELTFDTRLTSDRTITLYLYPHSGGTINIDWGNATANNNSITEVVGSSTINCTYPNLGIYTVKVYGNADTIIPYSTNTRVALVNIATFGNLPLSSLSNLCDGAVNVKTIPSEIPSSVLSLGSCFRNCNFNPANIVNWDTSNVTNMSYMFQNNTTFNQPIGNWNTSNVTHTSNMFEGASSFNQPIGNWNTSKVTIMGGMFKNAERFSSSIAAWDTSNVQDFGYMFWGAKVFNQPIGGWDTGEARTLNGMFREAPMFNQPIGNWNTSKVTSMVQLFYLATRFNQDLRRWDVRNFSAEPNSFSVSSALIPFYKPIWGTAGIK